MRWFTDERKPPTQVQFIRRDGAVAMPMTVPDDATVEMNGHSVHIPAGETRVIMALSSDWTLNGQPQQRLKWWKQAPDDTPE